MTGSSSWNFPSSYNLITEERVAETFVNDAISKIVYWVKGTLESFVRYPTSSVNRLWVSLATLKTAPGKAPFA